MHVFGAFEFDIHTRHTRRPGMVRVALQRYIEAKSGACLSRPNARPRGNGRADQFPARRVGRDPREESPPSVPGLREASVRLVTSFLLDRWIVSALPSEGLSHETCPDLLHSENVLDELAPNGQNKCA